MFEAIEPTEHSGLNLPVENDLKNNYGYILENKMVGLPLCHQIYDNIDTNPALIKHIPITEVVEALTKRTLGYELLWNDKDYNKPMRCFIDIDGEMSPDTLSVDFDTMDERIQIALCSMNLLDKNFTVMTSSKYNTPTEDNKTKKITYHHKLSYRITFTNVAGSVEAQKKWTAEVISPIIKNELDGVIEFYIKGVDTTQPSEYDILKWDGSVYKRTKMRCWNASKPKQDRPYKMIKGSNIADTIINYVPVDCEILPNPTVSLPVVKEAPVKKPLLSSVSLPAEKPTNELLVRVLDALPISVADDYDNWLYVGMACKNEGMSLAEWDKWSSKSKKYRKGVCEDKWVSFQNNGTISQSYMWSLLKKYDPIAFKELIYERKDFERIVQSQTHYEIAQYFYNCFPNDYMFGGDKCGWLGVLPSNIWEHEPKSYPPTLKTKLIKFFTIERIQFEGVISRKKAEASLRDDGKDEIDRLDKLSKLCIVFKSNVENNGFLNGVIPLLASFYSEEAQRVKHLKNIDGSVLDAFDSNPYIFAFKDCLYDFTPVREGGCVGFRPIKQTDYITITCGYNKPDEETTREAKKEIMDTLKTIWENNEVRDYVLKLVSTCLCGVRWAEVFPILTGTGGNGKGLLIDLVKKTFGNYRDELPVSVLTKDVSSSTCATPDIAKLKGKRFVNTTEPEGSATLREGIIKLLTGGDEVSSRMLYGQPTTFKPQFSLFIQTNTIPLLNRITKGATRRIRVIPFPFNFVAEPKEPHERKGDPNIKNIKCRSDEWRDAFFYILLEFFEKVRGKAVDEIPTPEIIKRKTDEYTEENNVIWSWFKQNYIRDDKLYDKNGVEALKGKQKNISSTDVLNNYKLCNPDKKLTPSALKEALEFNGIQITKITHGINIDKRGIVGWREKTEDEKEDEKKE
jgi:P4 family phage/plasmid primase-like protien